MLEMERMRGMMGTVSTPVIGERRSRKSLLVLKK